MGNNVFVLVDEDSKDCAVVDPGIDSQELHTYISANGLTVKYILLTHGHFDHAHAAAEFSAKYKAPIAMHPADQELLDRMAEVCEAWAMPVPKVAVVPDIPLAHGQVLELGNQRMEVRHTPGHSPGQVAFVFDGVAFVGDTLFWRAIGRFDLPGSNYDDLMRSIGEELYSLPGETIVWPGHGQSTTIDEERRLNPYIGESARFKPPV